MIIKKTLRPKELNEFNRLFGDLKHFIRPVKPEELHEETIQDDEIASKITIISEKIFTQHVPKEVQSTHNQIVSALKNEMNSVQKQIINMYCRLQKNAYIVLFGEDLAGNVDEDTGLDSIILNELLDEKFITDMRICKNEIDPGLGMELGVFDLETDETAGYITKYSNFKRMNLPTEFIKKAKELHITEEELNNIKFYYLILLDIAVHPFLDNTVLIIEFNRPLYRCLNRIIKKMDSDFRAFWQEAGRQIKEIYYKKDAKVEKIYKELLDDVNVKRGRELLEENNFFNLATGIILENELQIRRFLALEKEEKNIVISEVVKLERNINNLIASEFKDFTPEMLFEPNEYEEQIRELTFTMYAFKFAKKELERIFAEKGLSKQDWYFFKNMANIFEERDMLEKTYEQYKNADTKDFLAINNLAVNYNLNSVATLNVNCTELCKYILAYSMAIKEKTEEEKALEEACDEFFAIIKIKTRVNIKKKIMLEAQRKHGVSEARINLFTFFINKIL